MTDPKLPDDLRAEVAAAARDIWRDWFTYYEHRGASHYVISAADQIAFYEIAQPAVEALIAKAIKGKPHQCCCNCGECAHRDEAVPLRAERDTLRRELAEAREALAALVAAGNGAIKELFVSSEAASVERLQDALRAATPYPVDAPSTAQDTNE
jgi:hypothetical protein